MENSVMNSFDEWVTAHFTGVEMPDPPEDWDRKNEFFYLIEDKQYRIPYAKVPKRFRDVIPAARATSGL
jgi:hypothetical protein